MASDPRLVTSDTSLSADLIAQRGFSSSRRGFDPDEVRSFLGTVAQEFRAMRHRQAALEERLREAEYRAAHPVWDENAVLSAVGEETASILRSAHAAAADIKARAEDNAARILNAAHEQAAATRGEAEGVLKQRTDEAEAAAARVRELATAEAERTRDAARQQAEAVRTEVEAERTALVEAAHSARERILSDLSRRRNVAAVQIEQLRAGRERLLDAYRVVRETLDEVTDELQRADAEARAAAMAAGRQAGSGLGEGGQTAEGPEGLAPEAARAAEATGGQPAQEGADRAVAEAAEAPAAGRIPPSEPEPAQLAVAGEADGPVDAGGSAAPHTPAVDVTARTSGATGAAGAGGAAMTSRGEQPGTGTSLLAGTSTVEPPVTPASLSGTRRDPGVEARGAPAAVALAEAPGEAGPGPADTAVGRLFARIRADQDDTAVPTREVVADSGQAALAGHAATGSEPPVHEPATTAGSAEGPAEPAGPRDVHGPGEAETAPMDEDERALQRRDDAVDGIEASMARRLKRVLQDEQNDLLDTLRNVRGHPTASQVLPARDAHATRFAEAGRPLLDQAAKAGAAFVRDSLSAGGERHTDELPELDDLAAALAAAIVDPLRRRLEEVFADRAGERPHRADRVDRGRLPGVEDPAHRADRRRPRRRRLRPGGLCGYPRRGGAALGRRRRGRALPRLRRQRPGRRVDSGGGVSHRAALSARPRRLPLPAGAAPSLSLRPLIVASAEASACIPRRTGRR